MANDENDEDFLAREREFLSQLWEGHYSNKVESRKQIMTLSVAGLGLNLITNKPPDLGFNGFTGIWLLSTLAFLATTLLTLWGFSVASRHFEVQAGLRDPEIVVEELNTLVTEEGRLADQLECLTKYAIRLFIFGVITAIITVFVLETLKAGVGHAD